MKLSSRTIDALADFICGHARDGRTETASPFIYRSSSALTRFFKNAGLPFVHRGETRKRWVEERLEELNAGPATAPQLPADTLTRLVCELMHPAEFATKDRTTALAELNGALAVDGLEVSLDSQGTAVLKSLSTGASSATLRPQRPNWTAAEQVRRDRLVLFLDDANEDAFIEKILLPMFTQLGFIRVSVTGHRDRHLEFGKDLWMKYQLPTTHFLYFGLQAKRGKLDSAGNSSNENAAEVLAQVRMMLGFPIFDPETGSKHLLDHVFIACAGEITKQARLWVAQQLHADQRRQIIFLDRDDVLNLAVNCDLAVLSEIVEGDDDLLF